MPSSEYPSLRPPPPRPLRRPPPPPPGRRAEAGDADDVLGARPAVPVSWPPPRSARLDARRPPRSSSAPTPFGPPSLCADSIAAVARPLQSKANGHLAHRLHRIDAGEPARQRPAPPRSRNSPPAARSPPGRRPSPARPRRPAAPPRSRPRRSRARPRRPAARGRPAPAPPPRSRRR